MEDKQIIERNKHGKKAGFRILIEQYQDMILNLVYSYLGNREEAEDITQDLFIKVYNKINSFKGLSKLSTWMYRITINMCHDMVRKKSKMRTVPLENHDQYIKSADNSIEKKEIQQIIGKAIMQLSIKHRTVVILKDMEEKPYKEIASILKCSIGTVESRLFRAREKLKLILQPIISKEVLNEL